VLNLRLPRLAGSHMSENRYDEEKNKKLNNWLLVI
jgi:hypothetical protein